MNCSVCNYDQVRKFQIIYEEGTSTGVTKFTRSGSLSGRSEYNSSTKLADRCSPPKKPFPSIIFHIFAFVIFPFFLIEKILKILPDEIRIYLVSIKGSEAFIMLLALILVIYIVHYLLWSRTLWKKYWISLNEWKNQWYCLKCGNDFV